MSEANQTAVSRNEESNEEVQLGNVIRIDEGVIRQHLDQVVVRTVEETSTRCWRPRRTSFCGAKRYESQCGAGGYPRGHYERQLHTRPEKVKLKDAQSAEPAVRNGHHRAATSAGEVSVEEAARWRCTWPGECPSRVEDITEALWGTG